MVCDSHSSLLRAVAVLVEKRLKESRLNSRKTLSEGKMRDFEAREFRRRNMEVVYEPSDTGGRGKGERVKVIHASIGTGKSVCVEFRDGKKQWVNPTDLHDPNRVR